MQLLPLLGALIISLAGGLASFLVRFVTKKLAFGLAAVATLATISIALFAAMRTIITGISVTLTNSAFLQGLAMAVPSNAGDCLFAIATCWAACTLYSWQYKALDLFAKVS